MISASNGVHPPSTLSVLDSTREKMRERAFCGLHLMSNESVSVSPAGNSLTYASSLSLPNDQTIPPSADSRVAYGGLPAADIWPSFPYFFKFLHL